LGERLDRTQEVAGSSPASSIPARLISDGSGLFLAMASKRPESIWWIVARQHGVVTRAQLRELGLTDSAIEHRLAKGRLHRAGRSVYAVGRPLLNRYGRWMAAVLSCGDDAALSHLPAGALWGICAARGPIEISTRKDRRQSGLKIHQRANLEVTRHHGIPVTAPVFTLVDLATRLSRDELEAAINDADKRDVTDPEAVRSELGRFEGMPGVATLRETLDRRTFTLTDSVLERRFLPIARRAGLSRPMTGAIVNGYKVDFYWPDLGLVVETDGLRYHRTAAQQTKDAVRDQVHTAAGLTPLRFPRAQVIFEPSVVQETLMKVARRLRSARRR
jgi:very-short-patch-repair endonuclease